METKNKRPKNPWTWIPTLYFAEGMPYVMVMTVSVIMYKKFGISNAEIALYTSWLYLPWAIKPLWSPFIDMFSKKRRWILSTQFCIALTFFAIALTLHLSAFFTVTLLVFLFMAISSATHDIAADGFYMLGLHEGEQSMFVGVRSTCYRIAMIAGQGVLVVLAGQLEPSFGISRAWSMTFVVAAIIFISLYVYHRFILPIPESDKPTMQDDSQSLWKEFAQTFVLFFKRKDILTIIAFLLFYRFAEAQLVKLVTPFLLDPREKGGLGLGTSEVGIVYGTVGILSLVLGGLIGGYAISKKGLKWWLWPMVIIMHVPDLVFLYLSQYQPVNFTLINIAVGFEQFGYGFGFTAYTMYMIYISRGEHKTAHYAICTGIMALGMMLPGMISGEIQESIGYQNFFLWVILSTIPGFIVAALVKIPEGFGSKLTKAL